MPRGAHDCDRTECTKYAIYFFQQKIYNLFEKVDLVGALQGLISHIVDEILRKGKIGVKINFFTILI